LKLKVANLDLKSKAKYEKELGILKQKNDNLKKRLSDYNVKEKSKWASFRIKFDKDMKELGKALKNCTVKDK